MDALSVSERPRTVPEGIPSGMTEREWPALYTIFGWHNYRETGALRFLLEILGCRTTAC